MLIKKIEEICRSYVSNECAHKIMKEIELTNTEKVIAPNDLIVYNNGYETRIGKVKRIGPDGAFVWYHSGETAALTPFQYIDTIKNAANLSLVALGKETLSTEQLSRIINYAYHLSRLVSPAEANDYGLFLDGSICDFLSDLSMELADGNTVDVVNDDFYRPTYDKIAKGNEYFDS